ncbi:glycosyltransferase family 4 protein [Luteitalea sp. TBR-22]|uniref:glycosyltransferase family 4 protein n=1 Tax=Luteitalea sp. TBR-22 TaxID=2802971 RepID=UPI001EF66C31|nr:glycosyltransferase family 4 protein [Luteitalea sp. TBR-22]
MSAAEHSATGAGGARPRIALVDWTHLVEDFLDPLGVSLDAFCNEMTGGWMFGYVAALAAVGVETTLLCYSRDVASPTVRVHRPTGARIRVLPAPAAYRATRRVILDPYAPTLVTARPPTGMRRTWYRALHAAAPYLATPLRATARALREDRCLAILCQEHEHARFDQMVALGGLLGRPVYSTFQGGDTPFDALQRRVRGHTMRRCAGVIAGSAAERARVQATYGLPPSRLHAIFNPVDLTLWPARDKRESRRAIGLGDEGRVVAWHGRVDWHRKGLDVLVEAWRRIVARDPTGRDVLLLLGNGVDVARLREAVAALPAGRVHWIDRYVNDRSLIGHCLAAADAYAFTSRHEGLPVAPLEAMACGVPVVACRAPGIEDILGAPRATDQGGMLVEPGDPPALATALVELLRDDPRRERMALRARERIERAFALPVVGAQLAQALLGATPAPIGRANASGAAS